MNTLSDENMDRMDAFLRKDLSPSELQEFELRLQTDQDFAEDYRWFELSTRIAIVAGREEDRERLKAMESRLGKKGNRPFWSQKGKGFWTLAAAILMLFTFSVVYHKSNPATQTNPKGITSLADKCQKLYTQHFIPYENYLTAAGPTKISESLSEAMTFYSEQRYSEALQILKEIEAEPAFGSLVDLYTGVCYLETGNPQKATAIFEEVRRKGNPDLQPASLWYLALTALKSQELNSCKLFLLELKNTKGSYAAKARQLLKQLE